ITSRAIPAFSHTHRRFPALCGTELVSYHAECAVTEIRATRAALRPRALLGILVTAAALGGGYAHGNDLYVLAESNFKERDFERALKRYRKLGGEGCTPEGSRR